MSRSLVFSPREREIVDKEEELEVGDMIEDVEKGNPWPNKTRTLLVVGKDAASVYLLYENGTCASNMFLKVFAWINADWTITRTVE